MSKAVIAFSAAAIQFVILLLISLHLCKLLDEIDEIIKKYRWRKIWVWTKSIVRSFLAGYDMSILTIPRIFASYHDLCSNLDEIDDAIGEEACDLTRQAKASIVWMNILRVSIMVSLILGIIFIFV